MAEKTNRVQSIQSCSNYQASLQILNELTFTPVPDMTKFLPLILSDTPAGYIHGSLKKHLSDVLATAAKRACNFMACDLDADLPELTQASKNLRKKNCSPDFSIEGEYTDNHFGEPPVFFVDHNAELILNYNISAHILGAGNSFSYQIPPYRETNNFVRIYRNKVALKESDNELGLSALFLGAFDQQKLSRAPLFIKLLYPLWVLSLNLLKAGAVMPQLILGYNRYIRCRWIPASVSSEVRALTEQAGLVLQGYENILLNRKDRQSHISPFFLGELILSAFISDFVRDAYFSLSPDAGHELCCQDTAEKTLLYGVSGLYADTDDLEERAVILRMESWLAPLSMSSGSMTPVLRFFDPAAPDDDLPPKVAALLKKEALMHKEYSDDAVRFGSDLGIAVSFGFSGFPADLSLSLTEQELSDKSGTVLPQVIMHEDILKEYRYECLRTLSRLSAVAPFIEGIVSSNRPLTMISMKSLHEVLSIAGGVLSLIGVKVILPKSLKNIMKPVSAVRLSTSSEKGTGTVKSMLDLMKILNFSWQMAVGDEKISEEEFNFLTEHTDQIVRFRNSFVYADPQKLAAIIAQKQKSNGIMLSEGLPLLNAALSGDFNGNTVLLSESVRSCLDNLISDKEEELPKGLNAVLRPYQKRGYDWLMKNIRIGIGSILADDMGLGKTLQVISVLLRLHCEEQISADKKALIIVPKSLLTNWQREIRNFAPNLQAGIFYGNLQNFEPQHEIIITSYGTVRSKIAAFKKMNFSVLVVDEAQEIKNRSTATYKAVSALKAGHRIAMSGTPVENHLFEYYSILDFTNRGLFGSPDVFRKRFAVPVERDRNIHAVKMFRSLSAPFILRREKSNKDIISDLPEKKTVNRYCSLTPVQAALYQSVVDSAVETLASESDMSVRSGLVLNLISNLKAICNSPAQYDRQFDPKESGKVECLLELIDSVIAADGRALIFTQSVIMGEFLKKILAEHTGYDPMFLSGQLSSKKRMEMVDRFQNGADAPFMLLSLHAAGTGLNLTAANYVIHFDLWWNPAVESQATDRAYRIGQTKDVMVYRLICVDTFEEKINEMLTAKRDLADLTVTSGEKSIAQMSDRQLRELFSLSSEE